jgi:hypothetical protein
MEIAVRGLFHVPLLVENLGDVLNADRGLFGRDLIKRVEVPNALVAPATSCFALPARFVSALKLKRQGTRKVKTSTGFAFFGYYDPVRLTVQDRLCFVEVVKVPDGCPALLGRLPLMLLDLVVDSTRNCLMGNPEHHGEPWAELG